MGKMAHWYRQFYLCIARARAWFTLLAVNHSQSGLDSARAALCHRLDRWIGAAAATVTWMLNWSIVVKRELSPKVKLSINQSAYIPALTYAHELWLATSLCPCGVVSGKPIQEKSPRAAPPPPRTGWKWPGVRSIWVSPLGLFPCDLDPGNMV